MANGTATSENIALGAVYIETYGCAFNQSDSETMAGVLVEAGFALVDEPAQADLIILNTCTVKDRTYDRFQYRFENLKTEMQSGIGPKLIVAGCIPAAMRNDEML